MRREDMFTQEWIYRQKSGPRGEIPVLTRGMDAEGAEDLPHVMGFNLRDYIITAQREYKDLIPILGLFGAKDVPKPDLASAQRYHREKEKYRLEPDGCLVRVVAKRSEEFLAVVIPKCRAPAELLHEKYRLGEVLRSSTNLPVPIVDRMSLRVWMFIAYHHRGGLIENHRSADKTYSIMSRVLWWNSMIGVLDRWSARCPHCLKTRSRIMPPLLLSSDWNSDVVSAPWDEVMLDCEGPISPATPRGFQYILTYQSVGHWACILIGLRDLHKDEVRAAISTAIFRSKKLPKIMRSDRGQEFKNAWRTEFDSICEILSKYHTAIRPQEGGIVERSHRERKLAMTLLLNDTCNTFVEHWDMLLEPLMYLVLNTPIGERGVTPRDLECGRSSLSPLGRDLLPFRVGKVCSQSQWALGLFDRYQALAGVARRYLFERREDEAAGKHLPLPPDILRW